MQYYENIIHVHTKIFLLPLSDALISSTLCHNQQFSDFNIIHMKATVLCSFYHYSFHSFLINIPQMPYRRQCMFCVAMCRQLAPGPILCLTLLCFTYPMSLVSHYDRCQSELRLHQQISLLKASRGQSDYTNKGSNQPGL